MRTLGEEGQFVVEQTTAIGAAIAERICDPADLTVHSQFDVVANFTGDIDAAVIFQRRHEHGSGRYAELLTDALLTPETDVDGRPDVVL